MFKIETETLKQYNEFKQNIIKKDRQWLDEIFEHKREIENIIYEDDYILLISHYKWLDKSNSKNIQYLLFFKDVNLKSIRDINGTNITMIEDKLNESIDIINKKYNIEFDINNKYICEFHYHPSIWQLHIHIFYLSKGTLNINYKKTHSKLRYRDNVIYNAFELINLVRLNNSHCQTNLKIKRPRN